MKAINQMATGIMLLFMISACGGGGSGGNTTELEGIWELGCHAVGNYYTTENIDISGNNTSATGSLFYDNRCSSEAMTAIKLGSISIGNAIVLNNGQTVNELDKMTTYWGLILSDPALATEFNNNTVCGKSNWEIDEEVDITNCSYFDSTSKVHDYDIYKIDGNNLYLGDNDYGDGTSTENRPTQLETEFYTKK